ncbi:hypothetical protein L9F63_005877, partial [Diploptera punctata]
NWEHYSGTIHKGRDYLCTRMFIIFNHIYILTSTRSYACTRLFIIFITIHAILYTCG